MKNFNKSTLAAAVGTAALALAVSGPAQAESSVELSGWINEAAIYFDDGDESDVVQASDNGTTLGSRITFAGSTDLTGGLNAGFEVILEPLSNNTPLIFSNQDGIENLGDGGQFDDTTGGDIGLLGSSLHVGGMFGKLTLGLQSMPTDNIAVLADPSGTLWSSISPVFRGNGFSIRGTEGSGVGPGVNGEVVWGQFLTCMTAEGLSGAGGIGLDCNGIYRNGVRYDLPVQQLTGMDNLNIAVGYANDDVYDIAAKYNTTLMGRINTIIHAGYAINQGVDRDTFGFEESDNIQVQLGLMDNQTGLFGTFAYQRETVDDEVAGFEDDTDAWWFKVGVKRRITSFGNTALDFQYGSYNDQFGLLGQSFADGGAGVTDSEVERIGVALNQYFGDKLIAYVAWEQLDLEVDQSAAALAAGATDLDNTDELDFVTLGFTYFF